MMNPQNGKGSKDRTKNKKKYNENYDRIFAKKKKTKTVV